MIFVLSRVTIVFVLIVNAVWAIPSVLLIRIIRPFVFIRIGTLYASRIGHFVGDASFYLADQSLRLGKCRVIDLIWLPEKTCNAHWAKMVKRQLYVKSWVRFLDRFNKLIPGGKAHELTWPSFESVDSYNVFSQTKERFKFTLEEEEEAKLWLVRRGWREGEPFICLLVRDSAYLSSYSMSCEGFAENWRYHDYRDSDIDTYEDAIHGLLSRGYWVIRMGKAMHKPLSLKHQKLIDYPFLHDKNDLMDIWLSINCFFFISTASGLDTIPCVYGRPVVFVNALPISAGIFWANRIWVPKHLLWQNSGKYLTLREHFNYSYGRAEEYVKVGIVINDLSDSEITAAVLECEQRTKGRWDECDKDIERQARYLNALRNYSRLKNMEIHPEARAGSAWLQSVEGALNY